MTGKRSGCTRGHVWRELASKRRKAWKYAYRRLVHGASGVIKLGRNPEPPPDDDERQALVNLGRAIRELREQQGLSAEDLAIAAGVPPARIAWIEAGGYDPDLELLLTLADRMHVRPSAIFRRATELDAER
jgi:DNA-binding XRE family transcriptional regulator